MEYTQTDIEDALAEWGEVMFILESDREYEIHQGNVEEFQEDGFLAKGLNGVTGDYEIVFIPYDAVEHHKTHQAL